MQSVHVGNYNVNKERNLFKANYDGMITAQHTQQMRCVQSGYDNGLLADISAKKNYEIN
jgi:hypothetical protein